MVDWPARASRPAGNACRFDGAPVPLVVFVNPHSRANRRDPTIVERFARTVAGAGRVIAPQSLEELGTEARRLADDPPAVIAIHGGDGTLHRTITALLLGFAERALPPVVILPGGTMNVVAASLKIRSQPLRALTAVARDAREGRPPITVARRCLRIGDACGFVFGNGLMANFLEEYYARQGYGAPRALWILGRTFLSALGQGRYARRIFRRFAGKVWVDGQELQWHSLTGIGAATVREVGMGFKLNHRADDDPDKFAVLAIHAGPLELAMDVPAVHQGAGISPDRAWSTTATSMVIEPEDAETVYTIDGDLYRARGRIELSIGPTINFVKPATD